MSTSTSEQGRRWTTAGAGDRPVVWSYGGGTQSAAIAVLVLRGESPRPELVVMADTGREVSAGRWSTGRRSSRGAASRERSCLQDGIAALKRIEVAVGDEHRASGGYQSEGVRGPGARREITNHESRITLPGGHQR
jgi:hypothetical protein